MQEVKPILTNAEDSMEATLLFLDESLAHIRAGKANTRILDGVKVEYYGSHVPLTNVATVTTPDAKTITIQPWEKGLIGIISPCKKYLFLIQMFIFKRFIHCLILNSYFFLKHCVSIINKHLIHLCMSNSFTFN
mgnify:CR=1 FL=1